MGKEVARKKKSERRGDRAEKRKGWKERGVWNDKPTTEMRENRGKHGARSVTWGRRQERTIKQTEGDEIESRHDKWVIQCPYSALKRSVPPPPRIDAVKKAKNRVAYSEAATGLILWLSARIPFQKCSIFLTALYGVVMSITPR